LFTFQVKRAQTVYTIQRRAGALAAIQVKSSQLHKWLSDKNQKEKEYEKAIDTFTKSCAGYCVATFILGTSSKLKGQSQLFYKMLKYLKLLTYQESEIEIQITL